MWLNRKAGENKKPLEVFEEQFRISRFTNAILSAVMTLERFLMRRLKIVFSFGSSRLVVARKR